jgi:hypothetical protein
MMYKIKIVSYDGPDGFYRSFNDETFGTEEGCQ